jgi:hypothetical protein
VEVLRQQADDCGIRRAVYRRFSVQTYSVPSRSSILLRLDAGLTITWTFICETLRGLCRNNEYYKYDFDS